MQNRNAITKKFQQYLSKKNLRMTLERQLVLDALITIHDHFTVQELNAFLQERGAHIGRSTVYRMIPHLIEARILRKAPQTNDKDEHVYEHRLESKHHDHLICEYCHEVIEFFDHTLEKIQEKIAESHGYRMINHSLELRGVCPDCQKKLLDEIPGDK